MTLDTITGSVSFGNVDTGESYGVAFKNIYSSVGLIEFFPAFSFHELNDKITLIQMVTQKVRKAADDDINNPSTIQKGQGKNNSHLSIYTSLSSPLVDYSCKVLERSTKLLHDLIDNTKKSTYNTIENISYKVDHSIVPVLLTPLLSGRLLFLITKYYFIL